jgi:hypothetical protein
MDTRQYNTLQRMVCAYDFLALIPLAVPFLTLMQLETLGQINALMGGQSWSSFSGLDLMFVQLMGLIATGWTVWRWQNLSLEIGRFEGYLRLLVASSFGFSFVQTGHPLLIVFGTIDILLGAALLIGAWLLGRQSGYLPDQQKA